MANNSNADKKAVEGMTEKQSLFLEVYENKACNVTEACKAAGISRFTFYEWRKVNKAFDTTCDEIYAKLVDMAEIQLLKNLRAGNVPSLIFFLCNRASDRWKNPQKVEFGGSGDVASKKVTEALDFAAKVFVGKLNEKKTKEKKGK